MSTECQWAGHHILIRSEPAVKYLWLATETVVMVDGFEIGRSGGFRFTEKLVEKFPHNNSLSELALEMKSNLITLMSVLYKLEIEGNVISQGKLKIDNWILFFVPLAFLFACLFACLCFTVAISILSALGN